MNTRRNFFLKSVALALSPVLAKASPIETPPPLDIYGRGMTRFWVPIDESPFIPVDNVKVDETLPKLRGQYCGIYILDEGPFKPTINK
jgi:hypothetical protein